ncbi:ATP-binding cassette domain-containing protein [Streptomyces sp. DSM 3412]|uniref:ATP-binding cassette domain-containing protein n=1 Tax=Streptomyces gottesmaniae TaxID=3075518 RepID=A0ABU2Z327_9ACTN|nr:ATP-binding cassette domain-containing protein [Streptomyces sp. DSM 3412]MDT0570987.1 ATP-binding cassette domain-containing protein [Streptomyces sp. DSM 3412]
MSSASGAPSTPPPNRDTTRSRSGSRSRTTTTTTGRATVTATATGVTATGLTKSYGDKQVLRGIDLDIPGGTVFALLGPNGAGKTTTVQILSTLIAADSGTARLAGHDLDREADAVRKLIGVTGQFAAVDNLLNAEENLMLMADLHHLSRREGRRRAADLLARFDLTEAARKPVATYSGGMRRKLDLAMTLVGDPRIIFLDEPTTGLDPRSRRTMWEIIRSLVDEDGVTIFLTTQYLEEADQLADRIAVLDGGKLVAEGTAEELKRLIPGGHISLRFADPEALELAASHFTATARDDEELTLQIPSDGTVPTLRAVLDILDDVGVTPEALAQHTPDLDDVFLTLTGDKQQQEISR